MRFLVNPLNFAIQHATRWDFATRYAFAARQPVVPAARAELRSLARVAPVLVQVAPDGRFVPVVVLEAAWCREPVFDADYAWRRGPAPGALRYHPFRILRDGGSGTPVLGVASDPACVSPERRNAFFDGLARPVPLVQAVLRRLHQIEREQRQMAAAAAVLAAADLLRPLPRLSDARGATPFRTLDWAAFEALAPERFAAMGERPHDVTLLAACLAHSARHLSESVVADAGAPAQETRAPTSTAPAGPVARRPEPGEGFLVDDGDLVLHFD